MDVTALRAQVGESRIEPVQIVLVQATRAYASKDVFGQLLGVLGADELLVIRRADVNQGPDRPAAIGRVERGVVDGVAIDLADVEILLNLGDAFRNDSIGNAPDLVRRGVVMVSKAFPVRSLDKGDDPAGCLWGPSMILTG